MATVLCRKLKALRHALKVWSRGISRLSIAIENSNKALLELDELENKHPSHYQKQTLGGFSRHIFYVSYPVSNNIGKHIALYVGLSSEMRIQSSFKQWPLNGSELTTFPP